MLPPPPKILKWGWVCALPKILGGWCPQCTISGIPWVEICVAYVGLVGGPRATTIRPYAKILQLSRAALQLQLSPTFMAQATR